MLSNPVEVVHLGAQDYQTTYDAMRTFTQQRDDSTNDQLWIVEHPPVFTLGLAGDRKHLLDQEGNIPLVQVDRGGQITYHGPGQLVVYLLLNLKRRHLYVRDFVYRIEQAIIDTLSQFHVNSERKSGAPGIYVNAQNPGFEGFAGAKIAALGLKITKQCSYHGLSLNVDMDLTPFEMINPCGYQGLQTIDLKTLNKKYSIQEVSDTLTKQLLHQLKTHEEALR